ncbi:FAD-binding domain protein [Ceratobasidium sp. AG-Ba]|nr:FAD-binding domain protein [Ceratobasidium sp. AG-Ba]
MSSLDLSALAALHDALSPSASISLPGDVSFSTKRWALNAEKPAAIVVCPATSQDVAQILAFVQCQGPYSAQAKLDFSVKGGGHSPSGASSSDGGLVIDLQPNMHGVRVDAEARLAYVKGGSIWGEVDDAAIKHGPTRRGGWDGQSHGCCLTLGGGFGWLSGSHGLVIDNLVQATIVTASGSILTVSDKENQDLYWAIRGGGGNFGVVTEFVYQLHEQRPDVYTTRLSYHPSLVECVVNELNSWMSERTPLENATALCLIGQDDQPVFVLHLVYNGDSAEGSKKFERFIKLGPIESSSKILPYEQLNAMLNDTAGHGENRLFRGNFVPAVPGGLPPSLVVDTFGSYLDMVAKYPNTKKTTLAFELYHPAKWASVPSDTTAYVHRDPTYNITCLMSWEDSSFTPKAAGVARALDQEFMAHRSKHFPPQLIAQGGYTNYLDEDSQMTSKVVVNRRFGSNILRLAQMKGKYDPDNLFGKWFPIATGPAA